MRLTKDIPVVDVLGQSDTLGFGALKLGIAIQENDGYENH